MDQKPKLKDAVKLLDTTVEDALAFFDGLDPGDLPTMLKAFAQLGENYDRLDLLVKTLGKLYDNLSYEVIPNAMETQGFDSIKSGGKNFILSTRLNASIPENKREAGYDWLIKVAKVPELIVPRVNPKQLSSFIKSYFETHAEMPPEDAITVHMQNYIQVRKA